MTERGARGHDRTDPSFGAHAQPRDAAVPTTNALWRVALDTPHYLRFARSLALLGGLGAAAAGCASTNTPGEDAASGAVDAASTPDAFVASNDAGPHDAGPVPDDAFDVCATCICTGFSPDDAGVDAGVPSCEALAGAGICCAAIGPLAPPDLAVG